MDIFDQISVTGSEDRPVIGDIFDQISEKPQMGATRSWESEEPLSANRINDAIGKRAAYVAGLTVDAPVDESLYKTLKETPVRALKIVGKGAAGLVNDVVMQAGEAAYKKFVPDSWQKNIEGWGKELLDTPPVNADESLGQSVDYAPGRAVKTLAEGYGLLKKAAPGGMEIAESIGNIVAATPMLKGVGKYAEVVGQAGEEVGKAGMNLAKDVYSGIVRVAPEEVDAAIRSEVKRGFAKGIKPTIVGKGDAAKTEKFYDKATVATKDIIAANPEAIPATVEEFSQNVRTVKKDLWEKASTMAREAGEEGARVPVTVLREELQSVIDAPNVRTTEKRAAKKLLNEIKDYDNLIDPPTAEDLIASFNADTKGFWKNPDWNKAGDALMTERAANILRKATDETVEAYQGPGWQDFRNRYGAQTAIEKGVTDRANVHARANVKGFFDLTDVFTTGEFVAGLATMNPVTMAKAAAMYSAKKFIKSQNNVDNIVRKMFKNTKNLMDSQNPRRAYAPTGPAEGPPPDMYPERGLGPPF